VLRNDGDVEDYLAELSGAGLSAPGCAGTARTSRRTANSRRHATPAGQRASARDVEPGRDHYLIEDGMAASGQHVTGPWYYERLDNVNHWMELEALRHVDELLLDFLSVPAQPDIPPRPRPVPPTPAPRSSGRETGAR
jgi:hypothetical protein